MPPSLDWSSCSRFSASARFSERIGSRLWRRRGSSRWRRATPGRGISSISCFRAVLRKDWIASVAAAVLFTLAESDAWQGNILDFLFFLVIFALLVFVLLRLGLVSTMAAI